MTTPAVVKILGGGEVPLVAVTGDIDIANVPDLRGRILREVPNTALGLVLDLSEATYIDSQGVHMLLELGERLQNCRQRLAVVAADGSFVRRIIEVCQVPAVIPVEAEVARAVAHIRGET